MMPTPQLEKQLIEGKRTPMIDQVTRPLVPLQVPKMATFRRCIPPLHQLLLQFSLQTPPGSPSAVEGAFLDVP